LSDPHEPPSQAAGGERPADQPGYRNSAAASAQSRVTGSAKRYLDIGQEAGHSQFDQVAAVLHGFVDARARGDWPATCSYLSGPYLGLLQSSAAREGSGDRGCPSTLEAQTTSGISERELRAESAAVDIGSVRVTGGSFRRYAYVIYRSMGNAIRMWLMADERRAGWQILAPEPCSLEAPSQSEVRGCPIG
jgi:hypothetical protein